MGTVLDTFGPRYGTAGTVLIIAPAIFCMALVTNPTGFLVIRLLIGCSLCMFVCCQFWVGSMFNVKIVGTANALSAGWGNMGGGACLLIMPLIYQASTPSLTHTNTHLCPFPTGITQLTAAAITADFSTFRSLAAAAQSHTCRCVLLSAMVCADD